MMSQTIPVRDILNDWEKVFAKTRKAKMPLVILSDDKKPQAALISLDMLEEMRLEKAKNEALEEYRQGRTRSISTPEELEEEFNDIRKAVA